MAHNLKLSIYKFSLSEANKSKFLKLQDVFKKIDSKSTTKKEAYNQFVKFYIESFNGEFKTNSEKTKSIFPEELEIENPRNLISGFFKGGLSDIERDIFEKKNTKKPKGKINKEDITSLPYYFMMWTPVDLDQGIIMIQYYSSSSISGAVTEDLRSFFKDFNLSLRIFPYVPNEYKEKFFKKSTIKKISFLKRSVPKNVRSKFDPLISEEENFEIALELRSLNKSPKSFKETVKALINSGKKLINADLSDLGMDDEQVKDEMRIYYETSEGKKSYAKLSNNFDILPTIDLPDIIKAKNSDKPDRDKISKHCRALMNKLKNELNIDE